MMTLHSLILREFLLLENFLNILSCSCDCSFHFNSMSLQFSCSCITVSSFTFSYFSSASACSRISKSSYSRFDFHLLFSFKFFHHLHITYILFLISFQNFHNVLYCNVDVTSFFCSTSIAPSRGVRSSTIEVNFPCISICPSILERILCL